MNIFNRTDSFEFHDNQPIQHKVKPVFADQFVSIVNGKQFLAFVADMPVFQFYAKCFFVCGFKVSGAEVAVNLNRRANDETS